MIAAMVMHGHSGVRDYPWGYFLRQIEATQHLFKKRA